MSSKFCARCGKSIDKDALFCCYCGFDMRDRTINVNPQPAAPPKTLIRPQPTPPPKPQPVFRSKFTQYVKEPTPQHASHSISSPPKYSSYVRETPSVVEAGAEVKYADFWPRLIAWILDCIIIAILTSIIAFPFTRNFYVHGVVTFIAGWMYFFILEQYNEGQTLGKMALHLRTVDQLTFDVVESADKYLIDSLTKANFMLLVFDIILGLLVRPGDSSRKLRFTQRLANTVVIKTE